MTALKKEDGLSDSDIEAYGLSPATLYHNKGVSYTLMALFTRDRSLADDALEAFERGIELADNNPTYQAVIKLDKANLLTWACFGDKGKLAMAKGIYEELIAYYEKVEGKGNVRCLSIRDILTASRSQSTTASVRTGTRTR